MRNNLLDTPDDELEELALARQNELMAYEARKEEELWEKELETEIWEKHLQQEYEYRQRKKRERTGKN